MIRYKVFNQKTYAKIKNKILVSEPSEVFKGTWFHNCNYQNNPGYKFEDIIDLEVALIPDNFHFEIMNCWINQIEKPVDQLPFPVFCVVFTKQNGNFYVQFQISHDDNDEEWREQIKWIYEYFIDEIRKQVSCMDNASFFELATPYDPFYYISFQDSHSCTIEEAFNHALPKIHVLIRNTTHALQGMDRFIKVLEFWTKNKNNNQESNWHDFFVEHNWVLSQCFSLPFIFLKDKAYAGGKALNNRNGSILDFIYKNNLFENVAILEIKTPLTQLTGQEYRNGAFSMSYDLSGSICQLLNYKDRLQKEFYVNRFNSKTAFQALNPKCILLIGTIESLDDAEKQSFELFRSELKSIEIITYDELFEKINLLKELLT